MCFIQHFIFLVDDVTVRFCACVFLCVYLRYAFNFKYDS